MTPPSHPADPLTDYLAGAPCPPWCDRATDPGGHPYTFDVLDPSAAEPYDRHHTRTLVATDDLTLYLSQRETAHRPDQPATVHPPTVELDVIGSTATLATGQPVAVLGAAPPAGLVRQIAACLLDLADQLDPPPFHPTDPETRP